MNVFDLFPGDNKLADSIAKAVKEDSWSAGDNAWSSEHDQWAKESADVIPALTGVDEGHEDGLEIGDEVLVTYPNQFQGKRGEITGFGRNKAFVIVEINGKEYSMHSSDVERLGGAEDWDDEDEDYGTFGDDERNELDEGAEFGAYYYEELAQKVFDKYPDLSTKGSADELLDAGWKIAAQDLGVQRARYEFNYNEDFPSDFVSAYLWLQKGGARHLDEYRGPHDKVTFEVDSENAYNHIMQKYGHIIDWDGDYMTVPERYWPAVQELAYAAGGDVQEIGIDEAEEQLPPGMSRGFDFGPQVEQWKAAIQKKYQRLGNIEFKDLRRHIPKDGSWSTTAIVKNTKTGNYVILGNASGNAFTPEKIKFEIYDTPRELSLNVNEAGSDWEDEAEQAERFYQMVVKKLSAINSPAERESVAGQLSKIEQKYFGARPKDTLPNGIPVTPIVNSVIIALRAGRAPTANTDNNNPNGVIAVGQRPQTPPGGREKPMFDYTSPEVKEFLAAARNELLSATDTYELEKIIDALSRKQINNFRDVEWQEDDGMIVTKDILRLTLKLKDQLGNLTEPGDKTGELPDVSDADIDNADLDDLESYLHDLLHNDEVDEGWKQNLAALGTAAALGAGGMAAFGGNAPATSGGPAIANSQQIVQQIQAGEIADSHDLLAVLSKVKNKEQVWKVLQNKAGMQGSSDADGVVKAIAGKAVWESKICPVCGCTPCNCTHITNEDSVEDFLARGGKIQHVKAQKGPRHPGLSLASKHIGGGGDKMKASRTGRGSKPQGKPVVATEGASVQDVFNAITYRIERQMPELFTDYGVEVVANAIKDVAEFHEGAEELGSSDVGGMVREVVRNLKQSELRKALDEVKKLSTQDKFEKHLAKHGYDVNAKQKYWDQKIKDIDAQIAAWDKEMAARKQNKGVAEGKDFSGRGAEAEQLKRQGYPDSSVYAAKADYHQHYAKKHQGKNPEKYQHHLQQHLDYIDKMNQAVRKEKKGVAEGLPGSLSKSDYMPGAVRHDLSNIKSKKTEPYRDPHRPTADIDPDWEKEQKAKRGQKGVAEGEYDDPRWEPGEPDMSRKVDWDIEAERNKPDEPDVPKTVTIRDYDGNVVLTFPSTGGFYGDKRYAASKGFDTDSGDYRMSWKRVAESGQGDDSTSPVGGNVHEGYWARLQQERYLKEHKKAFSMLDELNEVFKDK